MKCIGRTKKLRRCQNKCRFLFCWHHRFQWFHLFVIISTINGIYPSWILSLFYDSQSENIHLSKNINKNFAPLFEKEDNKKFNVLIVNFEDYYDENPTYCIGRSIQENIEVISANKKLPLILNTSYSDSIAPPKSLFEAQKIQKQHNADLIIYGLVKKQKHNCETSNICFRYNIDEDILTNIKPAVSIKEFKHDSNYVNISPDEIEKGLLQIDSVSMPFWISSLVEIKANNPKKAFLELATILKESKTSSDSLNLKKLITIGDTYYTIGHYQRAIVTYSKALELKPTDNSLYRKRGISYKKNNQYENAFLDFREAIMLDSTDANSYFRLGQLYYKKGSTELATKYLRRAVDLDSNDVINYTYLGYIFGENKNLNESLKYHNKAISINPEDPQSYLYRAIAYRNGDQFDKALKDFEISISLDSLNPCLFSSRGILYKDLKQYQLALKDYNKAIKLNGNTPFYGFYNRALLNVKLKNFNSAVKDLNQSIVFFPEDIDNYILRGRAYFKLKNYKNAIKDFDKGISLNENLIEPLLYRGKSFLKINKPQLALKDFEKVLKLDKNNISAHILNGHAYSQLRYFDKAIDSYDNAILLNNKLGTIYNNRGVSYLKIKNYENAIFNFKQSILKNPYNYLAYLNLLYTVFIFKYWYLSSICLLVLIFIVINKKIKFEPK